MAEVDTIWTAVTMLIGTTGGWLGTWTTLRYQSRRQHRRAIGRVADVRQDPRRVRQDDPLIVQYQARLEADQRRNDERFKALEQQLPLARDYIGRLREHITAGKAPPPPDWPPGLYH